MWLCMFALRTFLFSLNSLFIATYIATGTVSVDLVSTKKSDTALIINPRKAISEFVSIVSRIEEILMASNEVENLKVFAASFLLVKTLTN